MACYRAQVPAEPAVIPACEECTSTSVQLLPHSSAIAHVWWLRCAKCGRAWAVPKAAASSPAHDDDND